MIILTGTSGHFQAYLNTPPSLSILQNQDKSPLALFAVRSVFHGDKIRVVLV